MEKPKVGFVAFFLMWAKLQNWEVPMLHIRMCMWLESCVASVRVLQVFRGAAKSTIYGVFKAWLLYRDPRLRALIWAADGALSKKLTRDVINVMRRHPLCVGMLPTKPGAQMFWVTGSNDARNASMTAVGVDQNVTSARADHIDYDDVEIPKNIKTPEARENLRLKIQEATFILVPGGQETYIGTPHTHDSIYPELIAAGAESLKIPLFESFIRYEDTSQRIRYRFDFTPGDDGLYVITGIHKFARLLVEGEDYVVQGQEIVFTKPPGIVLDIYAHCAWPERFTREDIIKRRKKTRTLNYWDSQYMLEAKPINECRLDPARIKAYAVQPRLENANREVRMMLGNVRIVSGRAYWDPSLGKVGGDASAFSVVYDDNIGNFYWHVCDALVGEYAVFSDTRNTTIESGQVLQACDIIARANIMHVYIETNGVGTFTGKLLQRALKQRGLSCGVTELDNKRNKNERILEALEAPMKSGVLWAHVDVLEGPLWDQMKDWNPKVKNQPDDFIDSGAGAIDQAPVRINKLVGKPTPASRDDWRQSTGVYEATLEA